MARERERERVRQSEREIAYSDESASVCFEGGKYVHVRLFYRTGGVMP